MDQDMETTRKSLGISKENIRGNVKDKSVTCCKIAIFMNIIYYYLPFGLILRVRSGLYL